MYVKPESVAKLSQLNPIFVRLNDKGDRWRQGYLPLPANLTENFQVKLKIITLNCLGLGLLANLKI